MSGEEGLNIGPSSSENGAAKDETEPAASSLEAVRGGPAETATSGGTVTHVEDSLGAALAGMNLGSTTASGGTAGVSSSFLSGDGSSTPTGASNQSNTWGSFATDIAASPAAFSGSNAIQGETNESLQLFLSRDPSQTLGENVFKLSHPNLPALEPGLSSGDTAAAFRLDADGTPMVGNGSSGLNPNFGDIRHRTDSPSSTAKAVNSASRSNSPYEAGRTIQAYHQPFDPVSTGSSSDDRSASGYSAQGPSLNASLEGGIPRSPYAKAPGATNAYAKSPVNGVIGGGNHDYDRNASTAATNLFADPSQQQQQQQQQPQQPPPPPQPGQVLYMAVPSPDGRGRVLQPVQMVQLPGKQMAYVVAGGPQSFDGSVPSPETGAMMELQQSFGNDPYSPVDAMHNGNTDIRRGPFVAESVQQHRSFDASLGTREEYSRGVASVAASFQPDPTVASLYSAPQRPPLDALLGQVRRLSRDQVGCRLVQQALDEEGTMAATLILQEGLPFWGEAMVDPFGNYLFQKILEKITPEERIMLVKSVSTRLVNASLNLHGTRSVQKIVELCALDQQNGIDLPNGEDESAAEILTKALAPAAARLCIDSHGNHVIQRIILKLGPQYSDFVFDAVAASVGDVARHRHGCCVIQRCLDSAPSEARSHLVRRIVDKALELMQDAYGNYVVQYVLDVCSDDDVHAVCESVVGKVNLLAIQKFSSNVMEKCLERCTERVKEEYMREISDSDRIRELMMDPFGNYVVQRALSVATHAQAVRLVEAMKPHLIATQTGGPNGQRNGGVRNTAGGRRIIAKICRRFPNFTLNQVGGHEESPQHRGSHLADPYNRVRGGGHRYAHQRHDHHLTSAHHQPGMTYNSGPSYMGDPRYSLGHMGMQQQSQPPPPQQQQQPQQQQSYYNFGGGSYYDPFTPGGSYGM